MEQLSASLPFAVIEAPSNLGLRPPETGAVPGADKAPAALREAGLHERLRAMGGREAGVITAGRYLPDVASGAVRNQAALIDHARRLGRRIGQCVDASQRVLVLGGDCTILLGAALALRSRAGSVWCTSTATLISAAPATPRPSEAWRERTWRPPSGSIARRSATLKTRARTSDPTTPSTSGAATTTSTCRNVAPFSPTRSLREVGSPRRTTEAVKAVTNRPGLDGTWVHVDVDVLDPGILPAVDGPDPGGVETRHLADLLTQLWPICVGLQVCVFDSDLDPTG